LNNALFVGLLSTHCWVNTTTVIRDLIEHAVNEGSTIFGPIALRQFNGFIQRHGPWDIETVK
jgi:hypothetical protein